VTIRAPWSLLCLVLAATLAAPPDASAKPKRKRGPAVAVWDVFVEDDHRAEAWHWYVRISEAIDRTEDLRADGDLTFEPRVLGGEGVKVASVTARRWLDGAWVAYRGREYGVAARFAEDALKLVDGFPAARLPDALVRDLELMVGRANLADGREAQARAGLRAALLLDPAWVAKEGWETPGLIAMWAEVAAERAQAPPATLIVRTSQPFTEVLVYGVSRGSTGPSGELELLLPPGLYEVTARKPGHADAGERVHLRPHGLTELELAVEVRNSAGFQDALADALADPGEQRTSAVWRGLGNASIAIDAEAVLTARYVETDGRAVLQIGLYLPGREGWGFYRELPLTGDLGRDQLGVEDTIVDLLMALEVARHPPQMAVGL